MSNKLKYILSAFLALIFFFLSKEVGMFWDNVLFTSKMGNHLYNNGLFNFSMPDSFDPGHPPFIAFLLALSWKVFGHTLLVSHAIMIPFAFAFFVQLFRFISFFVLKSRLQFAAFFLLISDPTLSAQFFLVNPEIIQLFFFLLAINSLLHEKKWLFSISLFFLGIVTFRGMMLCAGIFIFDVLFCRFLKSRRFSEIFSFKKITPYLIGAIPALSYVIWRLVTKGWLQTHSASPWEELWHFASLKIFVWNIITLGRWFADFGRIFVILFIIFMIFRSRNLQIDNNKKMLIFLCFSSVSVIAIVSIFSTNTFAHRYFIVSYLCFILLAFLIIQQFKKYKKLFYFLFLFALLSGNFWIYPNKIAQGWDASLAHLPYFSLRKEAIKYMNDNKIEVQQTASFFPNQCSVDEVDLSGDTRRFCIFTGKNSYVFYSNVYNLPDKSYNLLEKNYVVHKSFSKGRIFVKIYKHL